MQTLWEDLRGVAALPNAANGYQKMDTYGIATHGQLCACRVEVNKSL